MKPDLNGRNFTKLLDFSSEEIHYLVNLGEKQTLTGKNIVLVFEKSSTRTRSSFEVAAADQGASTTYLGPTGTHFGKKESVKDTARVLGGIYDGIAYRGFAQETVEALAEYSGVPVWNGLTDKYHPTQVIGDLLTMREHSGKKFHEMTLCYVGDTRNNVAYSLMIGGIKLGMNIKAAGPEELNPETELSGYGFDQGSMGPKVEACIRFVKATGKEAAIGALKDAELILKEEKGTRIHQ
jgi:ornithine carbamoyltransferase